MMETYMIGLFVVRRFGAGSTKGLADFNLKRPNAGRLNRGMS